MPAKKKTETHNHDALEAQVKSLAADVASLSLSLQNVERSLAELTTIDDLTETPEPPKTTEIQAIWDELRKQWPSRF
jgi:chaperonin cofactor prefoldin